MSFKSAQEVKKATDAVFDKQFPSSFESLKHIVAAAIEDAQKAGAYHATILLHETKKLDNVRFTSTQYFKDSNMTMVIDTPVTLQAKLTTEMIKLLEKLGYNVRQARSDLYGANAPYWYMIMINWYDLK